MQPFTPWAWRESFLNPARRDDESNPSHSDAGQRGDADMVGYRVEATDGQIGSVDRASYDVGDALLVVDTGPWIFGRKVLLPAGTVALADHDARTLFVDRTKEQIENSPRYDEADFDTAQFRQRVGDYYAGTYTAPPDDEPDRP
ncbi:PRC-barrel domain containing protein [Micromonospora sp. NPDC051300]|uniref:PRC-barrel domain containing protein n=1 Tax=Micromonospora sp. NPDC051300 TaxID=3364286 RepID=UPI0037AD9761